MPGHPLDLGESALNNMETFFSDKVQIVREKQIMKQTFVWMVSSSEEILDGNRKTQTLVLGANLANKVAYNAKMLSTH